MADRNEHGRRPRDKKHLSSTSNKHELFDESNGEMVERKRQYKNKHKRLGKNDHSVAPLRNEDDIHVLESAGRTSPSERLRQRGFLKATDRIDAAILRQEMPELELLAAARREQCR